MMRKIFTGMLCLAGFTQSFAQISVSITIGDASGIRISKHIYGHFAEHLGRCIYDGFYRNGKIRMDVVAALKKIKVPVLRWPGGCFADQYHWTDGIGPKDKRPSRVNTNWGMVVEDNSFGTDEFLQLCQLIGCSPYMAANLGSGTPEEMQHWLEYLNYKGSTTLTGQRAANGHANPYNISFWAVGNESWGCGGNMTPEFYTGQYKRYASFCVDFPGSKLKKIASGGYGDQYNWTETIMKNIPLDQLWGISVHYYVFPGGWEHKGSATTFNEAAYFTSLKKALYLGEILDRHSAVMDKYDAAGKVALVIDEWGIWTDVEPGSDPDFLYQQNSLRDALIAASSLNIFNNHAGRVKMANLAQTVNVLQALILTKGDKMLLTPTYHVFDMFKVHQDAKLVPLKIETSYFKNGTDSLPALNASASEDSGGVMHISLVNLDPGKAITVRLKDIMNKYKTVSGEILTSANFTDVNSFENPGQVVPVTFMGVRKVVGECAVVLPPRSVVVLELKQQ